MSTTRGTARLAGVGAAAALVLSPMAASAQTGSVADDPGDAPKVADITSVKVKHTQRRIKAVAQIPDLKAGKLAGTQVRIKTKGKKKVYLVYVARNRTGEVTGSDLRWGSAHDPSRTTSLPCSGIKSSQGSDRIVVSVPKSCLTETGPAKPVKAKVQLLARVGEGHDAWDEVTGYTAYLDRG